MSDRLVAGTRSERMVRERLPKNLPKNPLPTKTQAWEQVGLGSEIDRNQARRARSLSFLLIVLIAATLVVFSYRRELFPGWGPQVRYATVVILVMLGWALARELSQGMAPVLLRRMEPGTAGTVGFVVRLLTIVVFLVVALRIAGLEADQLALGGAFTAVIVGLAAQQSIGNLIAGLLLVVSRPFQVGDRIRVQAGFLAGAVEGTVGSIGLLHTMLVTGNGRMLVPNSILVQAAIEPILEPERVELRARFTASVTPNELQQHLGSAITVPLRRAPDVTLEEIDGTSVVVGIRAVPEDPGDGAQLAAEVIGAVRRRVGGEAHEEEPQPV